jgi:hypothetical protein
MANTDLQGMVDLMQVMAQLEASIAEFYGTCAEFFPASREFWGRLALEEMGHAKIIENVTTAAVKEPEMFEAGDASPLEALAALRSRLDVNFELLRSGLLTEEKALLVAYLLENTFAEHSFTKAITSKFPDCAVNLDTLSSDSAGHRARVIEKIKEQKGTGSNLFT